MDLIQFLLGFIIYQILYFQYMIISVKNFQANTLIIFKII
jgi:hypothetical protein